MYKWILLNTDLNGIQRRQEEIFRKHGVSFERAATVFRDSNALSIFDEGHSQEDEERWLTLGKDRTGTLLVVCHTFREDLPSSAIIRIISARKATKSERNNYLV